MIAYTAVRPMRRCGRSVAARVLCCAAAVVVMSCQRTGNGGTGATGRRIELTYRNSYSNTVQRAEAYVPGAAARGEPLPLLVFAHWFGGKRNAARNAGYHEECEARGWFCVCPQLHGEKTVSRQAWGSIESQHDLIDVIAYMREHYRIDTTRIYLAGRSMGGMTAQLMAAKYPDVFAAVVAGQGISDLPAWFEWGTKFASYIEEFGVGVSYTDENAFAYARRSSVRYGPNFRYVPLYLWHGEDDPTVPVTQTKALHDTISRYAPFHAAPFWLMGAGHHSGAVPVSWVCERLSYHSNGGKSDYGTEGRYYPELRLVTDEDKEFFWLGLSRADTADFGRISAELRGDSLLVEAENLDTVTVLLDRIPGEFEVRAYRVTMGVPHGVLRFKRGNAVWRDIPIGRNKSGTLETE